MNKYSIDVVVNAILSALFSILKAYGMSEEEAKLALANKINQIESLPPLPTDE